jgi:hypothetical protein
MNHRRSDSPPGCRSSLPPWPPHPMSISNRAFLLSCAHALGLLAMPANSAAPDPAAGPAQPNRFAGHQQLVAETHANSLKLRESALRRTIAKDTCWPNGVWGDNLWTLAALSLNEKVETANARLLKGAADYIETHRRSGSLPSPTPEKPDGAPWTFFSITDYVRTLCLFHSRSPHFPGRLAARTEAAMKEALWLWTSAGSRLAEAGPDDSFLLLGTENHDLNLRPVFHLVTALLQDDPAYKDRPLADGHSTAEHAAAHTAFFREWPRRRAAAGMWIEVGSNGYQKYSWPALINLHELSPDPVIRHRFGLLLDLAFVEEAQISVHGRRGGGRSRASGGALGFETYKNLLVAAEGRPAGSSHSRVIESSRYQLPPEAILLARRAFPPAAPMVIRNRVLGKLAPGGAAGEHRIAADSSLVNYAFRTAHFLLGSTLQNPANRYSGISGQNRAWGMLFEDPHNGRISEIHPVIGKTRGGRPQHSFWSVQHEGALVLQRIATHRERGSYSTGKISIRFAGDDLEKVDEDGWIFTTNGKAYAGVRFLDGGHQWDETKTEAGPARFTGPNDPSRILIHAGDIDSHGSFANFRETLRDHLLEVSADKVDYHFGGNRIGMARYDAASPESFTLPLINGKPVDLQPAAVYESPFLNGRFGGTRFTISVGPVGRVLDFSGTGE